MHRETSGGEKAPSKQTKFLECAESRRHAPRNLEEPPENSGVSGRIYFLRRAGMKAGLESSVNPPGRWQSSRGSSQRVQCRPQNGAEGTSEKAVVRNTDAAAEAAGGCDRKESKTTH